MSNSATLLDSVCMFICMYMYVHVCNLSKLQNIERRHAWV